MPLRPEVALPRGSLCLADLHLDPAGDERTAAFAAWIAARAKQRRLGAIAILGDLFDVWVGPAQARMAGSAEVLAALSALSANGCALHVVPGNRDFLLGPDFATVTGAELHPDGCVARLPAGGRALLVHGDELCTRDVNYQRLKRVLRSGPMRALAPRLPLSVARRAAARLRRASVRAIARKPAPEKAMQASAARELAEVENAEVVICGHAHAFRDERVPEGPRWIVLDAWEGERDLLEVGAQDTLAPRSSRGFKE